MPVAAGWGWRMIVLRIVRGVTTHFVGRWPEWVLSGILFAIGMRLLGPGETFASAIGYRVMAAFATEEHWGYFLCTIAGARLIALTVNGTFKPFARISPVIRCLLGVLSGFAWFTLAMGLYLANPVGIPAPICAGMLVADMINAILAGGDAGVTERKYRNERAAKRA
ncbi:MAG: hypothetical protein JWM36_3267 [Hyphomicrobiales bacterium]|nr:hypothetical protein [Hyphomicrobiales bacterium]